MQTGWSIAPQNPSGSKDRLVYKNIIAGRLPADSKLIMDAGNCLYIHILKQYNTLFKLI
jgi:hypothetical protein